MTAEAVADLLLAHRRHVVLGLLDGTMTLTIADPASAGDALFGDRATDLTINRLLIRTIERKGTPAPGAPSPARRRRFRA